MNKRVARLHRACWAKSIVVLAISLFCQLLFAQSRLPVKWWKPTLSNIYVSSFSPSGLYQALGGDAGVQIVSPTSGSILKSLQTSVLTVRCLAFSPDSLHLAVGGFNPYSGAGRLELWNTTTGQIEHEITTASLVNSISFSSDGNQLIYPTNPNLIQFLNVATFKPITSFKTHAITTLTSIALSPDGSTLAIGGLKQNSPLVELWNSNSLLYIQDLEVPFLRPFTLDYGPRTLVFTPDGKTLVNLESLSQMGFFGNTADCYLEFWDFSTPGKIRSYQSYGFGCEATSMTLSQDGNMLGLTGYYYLTESGGRIIYGSVGVADLIRISDGSITARLVTNTTSSNAIWFSKDGSTVYSSGYGPSGSIVESWKSPSFGYVGSSSVTGFNANNMAVSPDGRQIADNSIGLELRDPGTGLVTKTLPTTIQGRYSLFTYTSDSRRLVLAGNGYNLGGNAIEVWNCSDGSLVNRFTTDLAIGIDCAALGPDDRTIVTYGRNVQNYSIVPRFEVWDVTNSKLLATLNVGSFVPKHLAISPDGNTLAASGAVTGSPESVLLIDLKSGKTVNVIPTPSASTICLAFNSTGTELYVGGGSYLGISTSGSALSYYDVRTGKQLGTPKMAPYSAPVQSILFSADPSILLVGTAQDLQLVDVRNMIPPQRFSFAGVSSMGYVLDGSALAVNGMVGGLQVVLSPQIQRSSVTIKSLTITPSVILGGQSTFGSVTLSKAAPAGGAMVYLSTNDPNFQVPGFVVIPAGSTKASFTVTSWGVSSPVYGGVIARSGASSASAVVTIISNPPQLTNFSLNANKVTGGSFTTATVTLSVPASSSVVVISLTSSDPSVSVPASVPIQPGQTTVSVTVNTFKVTGVTSVTLTAKLGSVVKQTSLEVDP